MLPLTSSLAIPDERFGDGWWIYQLIVVSLSALVHDEKGLRTRYRWLHFLVMFVWNCVMMPLLVVLDVLSYRASLLCALIITVIFPTAWRMALSSPDMLPLRITLCLMALPVCLSAPILSRTYSAKGLRPSNVSLKRR